MRGFLDRQLSHTEGIHPLPEKLALSPSCGAEAFRLRGQRRGREASPPKPLGDAGESEEQAGNRMLLNCLVSGMTLFPVSSLQLGTRAHFPQRLH